MSKNIIKYTGNLSWLEERTIIYARHGSHAYGLSTPESDEDFKGVAIPPIEFFTGFLNKFEQAAASKPHDLVVYDIRKFFRLAADCNPNIIEVLWADTEDYLLCTKLGEKIVDSRQKFLSKKVLYTFTGYAISQLKRIKTHRSWLLNPVEQPPTRKEFGLPERPTIAPHQIEAAISQVQKQLDSWEQDFLTDFSPPDRGIILEGWGKILAEMKLGQDERWRTAAALLGFEDNFMEVVEREKGYRMAKRNWKQYQTWKRNRNPKRAAMEAKFGYDGKHALHLVRLMRMGREILTTGKVIVKRPDREELLSIRRGAWEYDQLVEWAERQDSELREIAQKSTLPRAPDRGALDKLCQEIVGESFHSGVALDTRTPSSGQSLRS